MKSGGSQRREKRPREQTTALLRETWDRKKAELSFERRNRQGERPSSNGGRPYRGANAYGEPVFDGDKPPKDVRGPMMALALQRAFHATEDPVFEDALRALEAYQLDKGQPRRAHRKIGRLIGGDCTIGSLQVMRFLVDRRKWSVTAAAEEMASGDGYFTNGESFDEVVKDLRERYAEWRAAGYPDDEATPLTIGDLGYRVHVVPKPGVRVPLPNSRDELPSEGMMVEYSQYWRRMWRDGAVFIARDCDDGGPVPKLF